MDEGARVLVSGSSGYIASHVVQQLQRKGYQVRGTVRSVKNEAKTRPLYQLCPDAKYPLELVEANLTEERDWPKAVKDCQYVMHMASPFPSAAVKDENELIKPAVEGTLNMLRACAIAKVKRVVLTSSVAAVSTGSDVGGHYDESNWTDVKMPKLNAYLKSKTLAEMAAWDYWKCLPEDDRFELAVINPVFVMGPVLIDSFTASMVMPKALLEREMPMVPKNNWPIVDVRDVAEAHLQAMVLKEAAGKRHICCGFNIWVKEMAKMYDAEFKPQGYNVPTSVSPNIAISLMAKFDATAKTLLPGLDKVTTYDTTRFTQVLGITPKDKKKTLMDMAYSMLERGMIKKTPKYKGPPDGTNR